MRKFKLTKKSETVVFKFLKYNEYWGYNVPQNTVVMIAPVAMDSISTTTPSTFLDSICLMLSLRESIQDVVLLKTQYTFSRIRRVYSERLKDKKTWQKLSPVAYKFEVLFTWNEKDRFYDYKIISSDFKY